MSKSSINVLCLGDIIGEGGRKAIFLSLSTLIKKYNIDFTIVNGENAAGGFGLTFDIAKQLFQQGVDVITSGNHIWRKKEIVKVMDNDNRILRPANYPISDKGKGASVYKKSDYKIGVVNLIGRLFMEPLDCPFKAAKKEIDIIKKETPIIICDFHAEATSEKIAMGWFLDGQASLVYGTHTHVQTADERILPTGTAYISDIGMVGPKDSIIGMDKDSALEKFLTGVPVHFKVAKENLQVDGIVTKIDKSTGKAISIQRVQHKVEI